MGLSPSVTGSAESIKKKWGPFVPVLPHGNKHQSLGDATAVPPTNGSRLTEASISLTHGRRRTSLTTPIRNTDAATTSTRIAPATIYGHGIVPGGTSGIGQSVQIPLGPVNSHVHPSAHTTTPHMQSPPGPHSSPSSSWSSCAIAGEVNGLLGFVITPTNAIRSRHSEIRVSSLYTLMFYLRLTF